MTSLYVSTSLSISKRLLIFWDPFKVDIIKQMIPITTLDIQRQDTLNVPLPKINSRETKNRKPSCVQLPSVRAFEEKSMILSSHFARCKLSCLTIRDIARLACVVSTILVPDNLLNRFFFQFLKLGSSTGGVTGKNRH